MLQVKNTEAIHSVPRNDFVAVVLLTRWQIEGALLQL